MSRQITIKSSEKNMIYSGVIRPFTKANNAFELNIDDLLTYKLIFKDEENGKRNLTSANDPTNNTLTIYFNNFNESFGISNVEPLQIGQIGGKPIYLNYTVYDISGIKLCQVQLYE